jgi:hypothetical protein
VRERRKNEWRKNKKESGEKIKKRVEIKKRGEKKREKASEGRRDIPPNIRHTLGNVDQCVRSDELERERPYRCDFQHLSCRSYGRCCYDRRQVFAVE